MFWWSRVGKLLCAPQFFKINHLYQFFNNWNHNNYIKSNSIFRHINRSCMFWPWPLSQRRARRTRSWLRRNLACPNVSARSTKGERGLLYDSCSVQLNVNRIYYWSDVEIHLFQSKGQKVLWGPWFHKHVPTWKICLITELSYMKAKIIWNVFVF